MRVKTGTTRKRRHDKVLKAAKGFRGRRKNCYSLAKNAVDKSLQYAYRDRKVRKRDFRKLWILRINAAARECGLNYSRLISGLTRADIDLDRRVLADIAVHDPEAFKAVAEQASSALSQ